MIEKSRESSGRRALDAHWGWGLERDFFGFWSKKCICEKLYLWSETGTGRLNQLPWEED